MVLCREKETTAHNRKTCQECERGDAIGWGEWPRAAPKEKLHLHQ